MIPVAAIINPCRAGEKLNRERPPPLSVERWEREADAAVVEAGYDGPHLAFPLTLDTVMGMLEAFKAGKTLHYKYAVQLVSAYRRYANELPTLVEVDVTTDTRVTVVGDTHGQLKDLFGIYTINGVPSPSNRYLVSRRSRRSRGTSSSTIRTTAAAGRRRWSTRVHARHDSPRQRHHHDLPPLPGALCRAGERRLR